MESIELDTIIHSSNRLFICALLKHLEEGEFHMLADELDISDSDLSKHIKKLIKVGYVKYRKEPFDSSMRTWTKLTKKGRKAYDCYLNRLRALVKSQHQ